MQENVFEEMAKRYDTEDRIELAKIISTEVRKNYKMPRRKHWSTTVVGQVL